MKSHFIMRESVELLNTVLHRVKFVFLQIMGYNGFIGIHCMRNIAQYRCFAALWRCYSSEDVPLMVAARNALLVLTGSIDHPSDMNASE